MFNNANQNSLLSFTIFLVVSLLFLSGCKSEDSSHPVKSASFMEVRNTAPKSKPKPRDEISYNKVEARVREQFDLLNSKPLPVKPITMKEIKDATLQMYVESVPRISSDTLWKRGNDPRKKLTDKSKENVRAVCLGVENGNYVFLTLRFFLDASYPNFLVQGLEESPQSNSKNRNRQLLSKVKMLRVMLSDVRHTGGGQIRTRNVVPLVFKNEFKLIEPSMVNFISSTSVVKGKKYLNPIGTEFTAKDVHLMKLAISWRKVALVQTFDNHDIALIKYPVKHWKGKKPIHLGLKYPTTTIHLLTQKQKVIFGFRFILMSKEAYNAIVQYKIPSSAKHSGIMQLAYLATSVLAPQYVTQIRLLDSLLYRVFKKVKVVSLPSLSMAEMKLLGLDFAKQLLKLRFYSLRKVIKLGKKLYK